MTQVEIVGHTPRRGVRVSKRESGGYAAVCACGWVHASNLRVICEDEARHHRSFHVQSPTGSGYKR